MFAHQYRTGRYLYAQVTKDFFSFNMYQLQKGFRGVKRGILWYTLGVKGNEQFHAYFFYIFKGIDSPDLSGLKVVALDRYL